MEWTDRSGRRLSDYPRPSVAVDVALLTVRDVHLAVLLHQRDDGAWSLPGTFVHERETLEKAVLRVLEEKTGVRGKEPRLLKVFDAPDRDPRGWVMTVAHVDLVPEERLATTTGRTWPVNALPPLPFDHSEIIDNARDWAQALYAEHPDPRGLLGDEFTLLALQRLHQAVADGDLLKDTFRRRMLPKLVETGQYTRGGVGKPARTFRRAAEEGPAG
jgi:ADP-ribose pyrophosphatase YjhB (NUDIX family)